VPTSQQRAVEAAKPEVRGEGKIVKVSGKAVVNLTQFGVARDSV
jgi:hypothetical protein